MRRHPIRRRGGRRRRRRPSPPQSLLQAVHGERRLEPRRRCRLIAYPWLASAVTRNPILIALVAVAQRLPWLVFTLPAGVITDRDDRRT